MIRVKITREENAEFLKCKINNVLNFREDYYVSAVVASEIGNSPIEACKAQAVAARTFAACKNWSVTDSSATDQAFRARRYDSNLYPNAVQAAEETAGEILTYNGKPISAVYSACNGGRTVSAKERWGSERAYLPAQDDPWDDSKKRTGHGVGMSQRGAKYAASTEKTYREILEHYYPGTTLEKIGGDSSMATAEQFIEKVKIPRREEWGYIYGTWGSIWTQAKQNAATREQTKKYGSKWVGKMVTDCSGLVYWALKQLGLDGVHHATYLYTDWCKQKGKLINGMRSDGQLLKPGSLVFLQGNQAKIHHVGVYIGDDVVIEAKGTQYGVTTSKPDHWDHWGELKNIDYTNSEENMYRGDIYMKAKIVNVTNSLNIRSGGSKSHPLLFRLDKGTVVDVLSKDGNWWQIQHNGRIGWACADYLLALDDAPVQDEKAVSNGNIEKFKTTLQLMRASVNALYDTLDQLEELVNKL